MACGCSANKAKITQSRQVVKRKTNTTRTKYTVNSTVKRRIIRRPSR